MPSVSQELTSAAQELRRLQYLAAMDVTPLVSRRVLPGAAPTHRLAVRAPAAPNAPTSPSAPAAREPARVRSQSGARPAALRELLESPQPAAVVAAPRAAGAPKTSADLGQAAEAFRLSAIVCAQRLWVEDLGDGALAREQLELVTNMARAIVHPQVPADPQIFQFDWPMHQNAQLNLDENEAAASLQGFLARQLDENACVELLCLGTDAWERVRPLALPCASRSILSTRQLLENPALKRDAWRALRPE